MLTLGGLGATLHGLTPEDPTFVTRLTSNGCMARPLRGAEALLVRTGPIGDGFSLYVLTERFRHRIADLPAGSRAIVLPEAYGYLGDGDVMRVVPRRGAVRVLYRKAANANSFLTTERCNNYCLMCSQPPKDIDDGWIVQEILEALPLIDVGTREIGLSGGEPTLLGEDLLRILRACKAWLPNTSVHMLSNGRRFADAAFAEAYAGVEHPDLMVGIPVYSDLANVHDYVVQADGAFDETIRGILNLKRLRQRVEIRVVIHRQTYARLPDLAEFLARNLRFVDHVALMGLEMTGFTRANLDALWIDPYEYRGELQLATRILAQNRMNVSIYNHQLCLLPDEAWPYARRSISDWKNEYMPECVGCAMREACGGFFSSARLRYSSHIRPFAAYASEGAPQPTSAQ